MAIPLAQSTASQEIPLGHFLDSTDGDTAETGLTIANTDIKLWKAGATTLANKNSGGATHIAGGVYYATLDATDTNTLGPLIIFCHVSGALAVRVECVVLPVNVYDSLVGGSDNLQVDAVEIEGGDATDAINAEVDTALSDYDAPTKAELDTAVADVSVDEIQASALADLFNTDSGTVYGSAVSGSVVKEVADNAGGSSLSESGIADAVWDEALSGHTDAGSAGEALGNAGSGASAASIADAVCDEALSGHTDAGSLAKALADILADTGTDGVVLADAAITAAKIDTDAITSGKIAADAIGSSELAAAAASEIATAVWSGITQAAEQAIADAILSRSAENVEDSASTDSLAELIMAGLNAAISGTTLTIRKPSDDSTFNTRTVTVDSDADPVVGVT
jgi:hypothetical protein